MATKHQRLGGIVPNGKQKNAAAIVPDGKNRPSPRRHRQSRCDPCSGRPRRGEAAAADFSACHKSVRCSAQLLAHAQAAAAAAANKKPLVVIAVDGAAKKAHVRETKPKPEVVNDISPDTNEEPKRRSSSVKPRSSRKKVHTMTSVLTARSKAAAGIADKPKVSPILDIDASDLGDQLAVVDYIEDIYRFYKHSEVQIRNYIEDIYRFYKHSEQSFRPHDYMDSQGEINAKMRAITADWLIEVHDKFELMPESLYLTFNIIDRYHSMKKVIRRELQLVGVSAMLIACKYEESGLQRLMISYAYRTEPTAESRYWGWRKRS